MRSMRVKDYMIPVPVSFKRGTAVLHAAHTLIELGISGAPVLDESGWIVGVITEQDCIEVALQAYYHGTPGGIVGDYMSANPQTIGTEESLLDAAKLFIRNKFYGYPVVSEGHLVGLITRRDVLRAMGEFYPR